jgi:hypothetical protein
MISSGASLIPEYNQIMVTKTSKLITTTQLEFGDSSSEQRGLHRESIKAAAVIEAV